jgi:hypothetical protein
MLLIGHAIPLPLAHYIPWGTSGVMSYKINILKHSWRPALGRKAVQCRNTEVSMPILKMDEVSSGHLVRRKAVAGIVSGGAFHMLFIQRRFWGSSVNIVTRLRAGRLGFNFRRGQWRHFFPSSPRPDWLWDPLRLLSNGYRELFPPGVKRQGREADHSSLSSAEVKNAWRYTSAPWRGA